MSEEFSQRDLTGARFERVNLTGARFDHVQLVDVTFRAYVRDVDIDGEVESLRVWGIDVMPLIEAELDRRHPERTRLRPTDPDGYREAWTIIEGLWGETVDRGRRLDPAVLHEHVNGEWSFIETLRHLVFATDAWVCRALLGDPSPWDPLDLPWDEMRDTEGIPRDREVRPSLDEVLALRHDRMATVRRFLAGVTDEELAGSTKPVPEPGYPESVSFPVCEVLNNILNEEWWHRRFAERDLDALTQDGGRPGG
ncbi:MAG: DinB family protein [Acidimicrobiia bacterium]